MECFSLSFHRLCLKLYQYSEAVAVDEPEKVFCTLARTHFYTLAHLTLFPDVMLKFCLQNNNKRKPRKSIDTVYVYVCVCVYMRVIFALSYNSDRPFIGKFTKRETERCNARFMFNEFLMA